MAKKILIVEDEADIVEMLLLRLEGEGYQLVTAFDGQEGLNKLTSEKPDLVILDIKMPQLDGYAMLVAIKEARETKGIPGVPDIPDVPIVVLTAAVTRQVRELVEREEIRCYMAKPFKAEELVSLIKKILGE